jgi:cytochrome c5
MKIIPIISIALGASWLAACNSPTGSAINNSGDHRSTPTDSPIAGATAPTSSQAVAEQWAASCGLCHATGVGGAPIIGMVQQWRPRLAKGQGQLLRHTVEGFNDMPPLGYCMSCEREDFIALIDFMAGTTP